MICNKSVKPFSEEMKVFSQNGVGERDVLVAQLCLTLCNPTDYSPPGSSDHGILRAGILEWVAIPLSTCKKTPKLDLYLTAYAKISSQRVRDLSARTTIKFLGEKPGAKLHDFGLSDDLLDMTPEVQRTKEKR